ncbi:Uma2 family endonuclease [Nocardia uniformis]|uniref:Uma2 family endonuclease n=1 Tax=Nocardia uniformis TaxID=53432 RepID=A0A849C7A4_9NOCA|nr:Uma2 family endonuclease [Nocardia uniformis]NNH71747.1 Uma2 family endonuclease [Nocardia uniformis]
MSTPTPDSTPLPDRMTWDELAALPAEQAERIELVKGRPVWVRTGPPEHQRFATRVRNALEVCGRDSMRARPGECWQVDTETNVFLSRAKDDFLTPDFLVYHCPDEPWTPIFAEDVVIVGEVLSPSNHIGEMLAKQARYAEAGISEYWEVLLDREGRRIDTILTYALSTPGDLPDGVTPLRPRQYAQVGEWSHRVHPVISLGHPFPISIPWADLAY